MPVKPLGFCCAFGDRGKLWATDTGHHAGGAHRSRAHPDLHNVGASFDQLARSLCGNHVARHDLRVRKRRPDQFDGPQGTSLVPMRGVDHEGVGAVIGEPLCPRSRITVDAHRDANHQAAVRVYGGVIDR